METRPRRLPWWLRAIHWLVIANFLVEIAYGSAMVFFVVTPGGSGPLMARAKDVPFELMATRRLYALETWVAICGLSIYVGVTEVLPRRLGDRS